MTEQVQGGRSTTDVHSEARQAGNGRTGRMGHAPHGGDHRVGTQ